MIDYLYQSIIIYIILKFPLYPNILSLEVYFSDSIYDVYKLLDYFSITKNISNDKI